MTVASLLKQHGYYTACIGKWHMGWNWAMNTDGKSGIDFKKPFTGGPIDCGFDSFFGICASLDIPPYCYCRGNEVERLPTRHVPSGVFGGRPGLADPDLRPEQAMLDFNAEIASFLGDYRKIANGKPFFIYYSLPAPHVPVAPAEPFRGKTEVGKYGDYVFEVDWAVGEVLNAVKEAGADDNTLIIFTADNGASPTAASSAIRMGHKPNKPHRGGKASLWDGGHRVPFISRWPGRIKTGQVNDELFCTTDLLATCADIVGQTLHDNEGEDSISMLPALEGRPTPPERKGIVHHSVYGHFAIRSGPWKYMLTPGSGGWSGSLGMPRLPVDNSLPGQLYHMNQDVYEANNLVLKHPDRVSKMEALLEKIVSSGRSTPGRPQANDAPIDIK
jgi:arylsulfatase A